MHLPCWSSVLQRSAAIQHGREGIAIKRDKNRRFFIALLLLLLLFSSFLYPSDAQQTRRKSGAASLPVSLLSVEEEAFAGTAFRLVIFEDRAVSIGERAFADAVSLRDVYLPMSVQSVGTGAFPAGLVVHGRADSFARTWAEDNSLRFVHEDIWNPWAGVSAVHMEFVLLLCVSVYPDSKTLARWRRWFRFHIRSMRPQDRPELHPIDYRFP